MLLVEDNVVSLLVVYGSLINATQLYRCLALRGEARLVFVKGYRRVFNQEPAWRAGVGDRRAVLNVVESQQDFFNGLLVDVSDDVFGELDERERGYERVAVQCSRLFGFEGSGFGEADCLMCSEVAYTYLGRSGRQNNSIFPNEAYLELCLGGAMRWGKTFYRQFLRTTYVGDGTLERFLRESSRVRREVDNCWKRETFY